MKEKIGFKGFYVDNIKFTPDGKYLLAILNNEAGFRQPVSFDLKTKEKLETDMVILAIGQTPDFSLAPEGIEINDNNAIQIDPITLETNLAGIFAGGDIVRGSATVISAVGDGKVAARAINEFLSSGKSLRKRF